MMQVTVDIVCKAVFSADVEDAVEVVNKEFNFANEKLIKHIASPIKIPLSISTIGNLRKKKSYKTIRGVVEKIIDKRRQSKEHYDDLLAMLMEAKDEETSEMMSNAQNTR